MLPLLASTSDLDVPTFQPLELGTVIDRENAIIPKSSPRAATSSIRAMTRLLWARRRFLSFMRGFGPSLVWNMGRLLLMAACLWFRVPWALAFFVHVLVPLGMIQVHILWVHTVLCTNRTTEPFWRRIVPFKMAIKAVGPPMVLLLLAETVTRYILGLTFLSMKLKWEHFIPVMPSYSDTPSTLPWWLLLVVLTVVLVLPAQMVLVRVEASLLDAGEDTIVPLDPTLRTSDKHEYVSLLEAWRSLTRTGKLTVILLYVRIGFIIFCVAGVVSFIDSAWWLFIALSNWRF